MPFPIINIMLSRHGKDLKKKAHASIFRKLVEKFKGLFISKSEKISISQEHNRLPPQECQRRLKLLAKPTFFGLPYLRVPFFPDEYFQHSHEDAILGNHPPLYEKHSPQK